MIIGMEWLEGFSPVKVHWAQKCLTTPYNNGFITLQGILPRSLECNMVELAHVTIDSSAASELNRCCRLVLFRLVPDLFPLLCCWSRRKMACGDFV
jgi:hypothetical protein